MSGIHVVYDLSQPSGSRIFSVDVRCASCTVPTFEKLENNAMYNILTDEFLRGGGDGYSMLMDLKYEVAGNYHPCFKDLWRVNYVPNIWFHQSFSTLKYNKNLKKKINLNGNCHFFALYVTSGFNMTPRFSLCLRLSINFTPSGVVVDESDNILSLLMTLCAHWPAHVNMHDFKRLSFSLRFLEKKEEWVLTL